MENKIKTVIGALFIICLVASCVSEEGVRNRQMARQMLALKKPPKEVAYSLGPKGLGINAKLNNKVNVALYVNINARYVLLSQRVAEKLGIDVNTLPTIYISVADKGELPAKYMILDSVEIDGVKENNIEAAFMLVDDWEDYFNDGLLGKSFLERFNFQVDEENNKLIFRKL